MPLIKAKKFMPVQITLRLSKELKVQLENKSKQMYVSLNALVVQILQNWVKNREEKADKEAHQNAG